MKGQLPRVPGAQWMNAMSLMKTVAGASLAIALVSAVAPQAFAQDYGYAPAYGNPPVVYGAPPPVQGRPLTVVRRHSGYNPYAQGPATVVTAPIHVASELVALPFLVVNSVFPAQGNTPLTVVGAPVYAAGQVAQLPFHVLQAPFGDRTIYGD